mmetsp:Transcript_26523/g.74082  ORF Transcript_26523/g.74082 Transcript_26523/m.74082 type:complete len:277 (+) Transcript_26523:139-969(+)
MPRSAAVAALLQLAVVCSLAVSVQHAPSEGGGLMGNPADIENVETGTTWFSVRIKVPTGESASKEPQAKLMGWQLGSEQGSPVQVLKIRSQGIVARHNAGGGERPILAGDELVEVNGVKWNGDTRAFEAALGKEIQATMRAPLRLLRLTVQRRKLAEQAAKAQEQETEQMIEATAQRSNIQRVEVEEKATISADIQEKTQIGEEKANGSTDVQATGSNLLEERPTLTAEAQAELSISKVEGLIAAWNKLHPEDPIELDQEKFRKAMSESLVSRDVV